MDQRPKRALGQNFLVDPNLQRMIVERAGIGPDDTVLEIGPGRGALTRLLSERAGRLVLVELDDDLAPALRSQFASDPHVEVHHGDILDVDIATLVDDPGSLRVIGNIPYNITTPIIFHLLAGVRPADILLMVQKEVGDRIMAETGTSGYGALSVGVRSVATVERVLSVPPGAFRPRPKVDSSVIRITPIRPPPLSGAEEKALRRLTRATFQWRRKQLKRTLRDHPDLRVPPDRLEVVAEAVGLDLRRRPETLSPREFIALAGRLFPTSA